MGQFFADKDFRMDAAQFENVLKGQIDNLARERIASAKDRQLFVANTIKTAAVQALTNKTVSAFDANVNFYVAQETDAVKKLQAELQALPALLTAKHKDAFVKKAVPELKSKNGKVSDASIAELGKLVVKVLPKAPKKS